jgi:hypothetical protein
MHAGFTFTCPLNVHESALLSCMLTLRQSVCPLHSLVSVRHNRIGSILLFQLRFPSCSACLLCENDRSAFGISPLVVYAYVSICYLIIKEVHLRPQSDEYNHSLEHECYHSYIHVMDYTYCRRRSSNKLPTLLKFSLIYALLSNF